MIQKATFLFLMRILPVFLTIQLEAQTEQFHRLGTPEGLSQSSVFSLHQDAYGFIWMGTRDGVNRYDGHVIEVYKHIPYDTSSLSGNIIFDISSDPYGYVWIATVEGLNRYNYHTDRIESITIPTTKSFSVHPAATSIKYISELDLLLIGTKNGLFEFHYDTKRVKPVRYQTLKDQLDGKNIQSIDFQNNHLWVGTRDGLFHYELDANVIKHYYRGQKNEHLSIPFSNIEDILITDEGDLWVAGYGSGIFKLSSMDHFNAQNAIIIKDQLASPFVRALATDHQSNVWIGTFQGINIYSPNGKIVLIEHEPGNNKSLSHNSIRSLLTDRDGNIWIGTYYGGVNFFSESNQFFSHFEANKLKKMALPGPLVSCFDKDPLSSIVYVGMENTGFTLFHPDEGVFNEIAALNGHTIKSILADESGAWISSFRNGLFYYHRYNKEVKPVYIPYEDLIINDILLIPTGELLLATDKYGVLMYDPQKNRVVEYPVREELLNAISKSKVRRLYQDITGNLWVGTHERGLILVNWHQKMVQRFHPDFLPEHDLLDIKDIYEDLNGTIWLGTYGKGLYAFDRVTGRFRVLDSRFGLDNNIVLQVEMPVPNQLWVSTTSGINVFNLADSSWTVLNYANGFPLLELNENAFMLTPDSLLYIGGINGMCIFDPSLFFDDELKGNIHISGIYLGEKKIQPGDNTNILHKSILMTDQLQIAYNQTNLSFQVSDLNYFSHHRENLYFKITGLNDEWQKIDETNRISLVNLPDGNYLLEVSAMKNGVISKPSLIQLELEVSPPAWRSWWAIGLYFSGFLVGLFLIRETNIRRVKLKHQLSLKQAEKEQLENLHQLKMKSFTDVSHEFKTPLSLIIDPIYQVLEKYGKDIWLKKRLQTAHFNAIRLNNLVNQILEIRASENGKIVLQKDRINLAELTTHTIQSFQATADRNRVKLKLHIQIDYQELVTDRDKYQKILYNLISNAIKYNVDDGEVIVSLTSFTELDKHWVKLKVSDTGQGIPGDKLDKVFDRFYRLDDNRGTGIGLSYIRTMLDLMGGEIEIQSELNKGSIFTAFIPVEIIKTHKPAGVEHQMELPQTEKTPKTKTQEIGNTEKPVLLVIDDDPDIRSYIVDYFRSNYEILEAENGLIGFEMIARHIPDLVISDVMMPGQDGISLCKRVKKDPAVSHIPVILLTAKVTTDEKVKGLEAGADDYITKPFSMKEVEVRIRNIIESRSKLRNKLIIGEILPMTSGLTDYDHEIMRKVVEAINKNIQDPELNVDLICKEVGISRAQLYRKLKGVLNTSPGDFIREMKMKKAALLLEKQKMSVNELAIQVGFDDSHYFSKVFKKHFGVSPMKYTKKVKVTDNQ